MKPVFEITPKAIFFQQTNLFCEISRDGFSCIFMNDTDKKFHGLFVFYFNNDATVASQLKEVFTEQPLLRKAYKKVFVSWSGEESALLPEELYKTEESENLLNTLYGDNGEYVAATDLVADKKIYNTYRIPATVQQVIVEQFPLAAITHQYSLLVRQDVEGDLLKVIFYKDTFVLQLVKDGALQIIRTCPYQSGDDVVYHLLNTCRQFNCEEVPLQAGGMIDKDSDLHKKLLHYFEHFTFDALPASFAYTRQLSALPPYYFSHLFSLALCV